MTKNQKFIAWTAGIVVGVPLVLTAGIFGFGAYKANKAYNERSEKMRGTFTRGTNGLGGTSAPLHGTHVPFYG